MMERVILGDYALRPEGWKKNQTTLVVTEFKKNATRSQSLVVAMKRGCCLSKTGETRCGRVALVVGTRAVARRGRSLY